MIKSIVPHMHVLLLLCLLVLFGSTLATLYKTVYLSPSDGSVNNFPCDSIDKPCNSLSYIVARWIEVFNSSSVQSTEQFLQVNLLNSIVESDMVTSNNCNFTIPSSVLDQTQRAIRIIGFGGNSIEITCPNSFVRMENTFHSVQFQNVNLKNSSALITVQNSIPSSTSVRSSVVLDGCSLVLIRDFISYFSTSITNGIFGPSVTVRNCNLVDSSLASSFSLSVSSTTVNRTVSSISSITKDFSFSKTDNVATFDSCTFNLIYDLPVEKNSLQDCPDKTIMHSFIYGETVRRLNIFNSLFNGDDNCLITGGCVGLGSIICFNCKLINISQTQMTSIGDMQLRNDISGEDSATNQLYMANNVYTKSQCHYLSLQGFETISINKAKFENNSNSGTWSILSISDSITVSIEEAIFGLNTGGALFLQNNMNTNVVLCSFYNNMGAPALRFLDLEQYSGGSSQSILRVSRSSFFNNFAKYGGAINSNSLHMEIMNCNFNSNAATRHGGHIFVADLSDLKYVRTLLLKDSRFFNGTNALPSSFGGFVYLTSESGSLNVENCIFETSFSQDSGGCLYIDVPASAMTNTKVFNCFSLYDGGAIYFEKGTMDMKSTTLTNNTCGGYGAGFYAKSGTKSMISNSTFRNNVGYQGRAGGIYGERKSSFNITLSTFDMNKSTMRGAAIYVSRGEDLSITHSTFSSNVVYYDRSVVYNEQGPAGAAIFAYSLTTFVMRDVKFIGNTISNQKRECIGGAVLLAPSTSYTIFENLFFSNNVADMGGALYVYDQELSTKPTVQFKNLIFSHNTAIRQGGAIFLANTFTDDIVKQCMSSTFDNNMAIWYGNDYASGPKYFRLKEGGWIPETITYNFPLDILNSMFGSPLDNSGLVLYPGQRLTVSIDSYDLFEQRMMNIRGIDVDLVLSSTVNDTSKEYNTFYAGTFSNDSALFQKEPIIGMENQTLFLHFNCKDVVQKYYVQVQLTPTCPFSHEYSLDNRGCRPVTLYQSIFYVVIGITSGVGLTFIILMLLGCLYFVRRKLKELRKREKLEEDLHKRLLEYQLLATPKTEESISNTSKNRHKVEDNQSWIIKVEDLKIIDRIGQGGESVIFLAKWMNNNVAVKRIQIEKDDTEEEDSETINSTFEKEAYILSTLRFPNIVSFYGIAITPSDRFIVIEYLSGGNLRKKIQDSKKKKVNLTMSKKLNYLLDIGYGMKYLHGLEPPLIHRDLKPENILISENDVAKICDFGLGRQINTGTQTSNMTSQIGTPSYIAPEIILDLPYTEKCDVYSYGIVMWELLFEEKAFSKEGFEFMKDFLHRHEDLLNTKPYEPIQLDRDQAVVRIDDQELSQDDSNKPLLDNITSPEYADTEDNLMDSGSLNLSNFNFISITTEIVKGLRPTVPFRIKRQFHTNHTSSGDHLSSSHRRFNQVDPLLKEWVREYMLDREKNSFFSGGSKSTTEMRLCLALKEYCLLMVECWDNKESNRPSFTEVCDRLLQCSRILC